MSDGFHKVAESNGVEELILRDNGLRVLLLPQEGVPVVAVCLVYHVGSRNEAVGHTGATHLLEHLLFKGTRAFDPVTGRSIARVLERVGASYNATTWFDRTNYYETLPAEHLELALEIEADRMRHALLRADDLAAEMTVVRNELSRGENDPFSVLLKESFAIAFREHPYHHPTIGWRSDVENVAIDRLRSFYDTFYHPDNATLILVGSFQRNAALALVEKHFAPLPRAPQPIPAVITTEPPQEGERRFLLRRSAEVGWVVTSWRAPQAAHGDAHALAVLADTLTGGVTSRLYQKLVETGRCLAVQALCWQLRDPGLFQVFATLNPPASHDEVEAVIRDELKELATAGPGEEEIERAKVQVEAETAFHRDSPGQVAAALAEAVSAADWRFYLDYPARTRAVSGDDVRRVAGEYFQEDSLSVGHFVPRTGTERGRGGVGGHGPQPCFWRATLADRVTRLELPGGATALVVGRHENPTVHLQGSLLAGHGMVAPEDWAAASVLPEMLERGTRGYDRLSLARALEDRAVELDISGESFNPHEVFISGRCLARHLPVMLELLVEQLRFATFPGDELERVRMLRLGELAQAQEDTFVRAFEAFTRLTYPAGHPCCRRPVSERREALTSLAREDLARSHGTLYGPGSLILTLVGDLEPGEVESALAGLLGGWTGGATEVPRVARRGPAEVVAAEDRVAMPDKPNLDVVLGHPGGLRRRDPDFLAAMLANALLGQSTLSSRLGRRLRDREGLTYGVVSRFFGASLLDGPWAVAFSIDSGDLERALEVAREEVTRFIVDGPQEDELADERAAMAGSYRVSLATPAGLAREISRLTRFGLPLQDLDELPARILGTPLDEVLAAARRHMDVERLCLAVAGDIVDRDGREG